jgi:ribosomal protein S18 acetylase RimI-like enzyme
MNSSVNKTILNKEGLMNDKSFGSSAGSPVIRKMVSSDLERVIEIDFKVLEKARPEHWKAKLAQVEQLSRITPLVALIEDRVVGFIIGGASRWEYGVPENIGWIDTIGVDPEYQRKGIAKILFSEMIKDLKKKGVDSITTFVNRRDPQLLNFFNNLGFRKGGMINLELDI